MQSQNFWTLPEPDFVEKTVMRARYDTIVVGGGFAGLSVAIDVKRKFPSHSVVVIEAEYVGAGASGKAAGWLNSFPPIWWPLENLNNKDRIKQFRDYLVFKNNQIRHIIKSYEFEDQVDERTHLLTARNRMEWSVAKLLHDGLSRLGFETELKCEKPGLGYSAIGYLGFKTMLINPVQLLKRMVNFASALGVEIIESTKVAEIQGTHSKVVMPDQTSVEFGRLVICTNAYTDSIKTDFSKPKLQKYTSTILCSKELTQTQSNLISENQNPFGDASYFYSCGRFYKNRILWNGGDRSIVNAEAVKENESWAKAILLREWKNRFPFVQDVDFSFVWTGLLHQQFSEVPYVASSDRFAHVIYNIGYGGSSGISYAMTSGEAVLQLLENDKSSSRLSTLNDYDWCLKHFTKLPWRFLSGMCSF